MGLFLIEYMALLEEYRAFVTCRGSYDPVVEYRVPFGASYRAPLTLQHTATHCNTLQHTATHLVLHIGLLWVHCVGLLSVEHSLLTEYRALSEECMSLLAEHRALLEEYTALLVEYRALLEFSFGCLLIKTPAAQGRGDEMVVCVTPWYIFCYLDSDLRYEHIFRQIHTCVHMYV